MKKQKGLTLSSLQAAGLAMVVLVIVIAIGAQIVGEVRGTQTVNTTEYNVSDEGLGAMSEFADWFTIIVIVLIAVVIISLLVRGLGGSTTGV